MQLWMGFSKFLNFPQVPNVSNEVGPWFSLETWSSTTHSTYFSNQNCMVPLWPLEGGHVSEEYFLPAAIFKKMYQLLTKKRKGNFCVKKNYNNIPISSSHSSTRLVCGPVATLKAGGMVQFMFQCHGDAGSVIWVTQEPDQNQPTNIGDSLCILRAKRTDIYSLIVWEGS